MRLDGSCQCGKIRFHVESDTPYPYQFCFCSICRKCTGALTCNIMGRRPNAAAIDSELPLPPSHVLSPAGIARTS